MELKVEACDLGLSAGRFGACSVSTERETEGTILNMPQRLARAAAGAAFGGLAAASRQRRWAYAPGAVAAWFGVSHLLAAYTGFDGCPELGAVPSVVLGRKVATECGPWEWIDARLGISGE